MTKETERYDVFEITAALAKLLVDKGIITKEEIFKEVNIERKRQNEKLIKTQINDTYGESPA